jgi:hypothetical protein
MQEAAETERDGFPYSNAVIEVDNSRARQADDSTMSMPFRESQQGVTLSPSTPSPFPASAGMAGGRLDCHNPKASGRALNTLMDGTSKRKRRSETLCSFVQRSAVKVRGWREVQPYHQHVRLTHASNHVHRLCHTAAQARGSALLLLVGAPCVTTCLVKTMMASSGKEND